MREFEKISIAGRYIFGYFCLIKLINSKDEDFIHDGLDEVLKEFTSTDRKDVWHERAAEMRPDLVLDLNYGRESYEYITYDLVLELRNYYNKQSPLVVSIIDNLIDLGISNLYCGFESRFSMKRVDSIIEDMERAGIDLPDMKIVEGCSVDQRGGWGDLVEIDGFLSSSSGTN